MHFFTKIISFFLSIVLAMTGWIGYMPQHTLKVNRYDAHQTNDGFGTSSAWWAQEVSDEAEAERIAAQKALVTNADSLTEAIARYNELKAQAETPTDPTDPGNTTEPTDPDTPSGDNVCKWDNVDHVSFLWGRPVKSFHSVLSFFAHLFGRRSFSKYENMFLKTGWLF